jgi:hypothetical protein
MPFDDGTVIVCVVSANPGRGRAVYMPARSPPGVPVRVRRRKAGHVGAILDRTTRRRSAAPRSAPFGRDRRSE